MVTAHKKEEDQAAQETLDQFAAAVDKATNGGSLDDIMKNEKAEEVPLPAKEETKAPEPVSQVNVPLEVNEDGTLSERMAAALEAIQQHVKPQRRMSTPEERMARIKFAGGPSKDKGPVFLGRKRLVVKKKVEAPELPYADLCAAIMEMRCPECEGMEFRFGFQPAHLGLPGGYCPHCSYQGDIVEIGILTEQEAIARLKANGVDVEVE